MSKSRFNGMLIIAAGQSVTLSGLKLTNTFSDRDIVVKRSGDSVSISDIENQLEQEDGTFIFTGTLRTSSGISSSNNGDTGGSVGNLILKTDEALNNSPFQVPVINPPGTGSAPVKAEVTTNSSEANSQEAVTSENTNFPGLTSVSNNSGDEQLDVASASQSASVDNTGAEASSEAAPVANSEGNS